MASLQFYRMAFGPVDRAQRAHIQEALRKYCERDTLARVELRKALSGKARTPPAKCSTQRRL
jgi:hypothetical protein